jgi:hypothetical protein
MNISVYNQLFIIIILIISIITNDINKKHGKFDEHRHHRTNNIKRNKITNNKLKFDFDITKSSTTQLPSPMKHFRDHLQRLNEKLFDNLYFCSSIYKDELIANSSKQLWILRNKKCLNLSDTRHDFFQAFQLCKNQPYSYNYLISKSEIIRLIENKNNHQIGLDIYQAYFKLLIAENYKNKSQDKRDSKNQTKTVSLWLNDDYLMSHECENRDYAPVIHINEKECEFGCFECVHRNAKPGFYSICSKACNWKVPYHSFCNTMEIDKFKLNKNLYYQQGMFDLDTKNK